MRDSFTPEEVDRIENKAYEVGVGIGASQERERIIALLETLNIHCIDCMSEQFDELGLPKAEYTIDRLIALIKGENK